MTAIFANGFGSYTYPGDNIEAEAEGFTLIATIEPDDDADAPWDREDGHGPVTGWTRRAKLPGERVLNTDRGSYRYYDFAEACRIARRDGWGCEGGQREGESARAYAARAAEADFERLRAWCNDDWSYVGVVVRAYRDGIKLGSASLWGIESDATDYLGDVAEELVPEAIAEARATISRLAA